MINNSTDFALPFHIEHSDIRGRFVELSSTLTTILNKHAYPQAVADLLTEATLMGVMLTSLLKFKGLFTLQIKGNGPVKLLVVDLTSEGDVRANAQFDPEGLTALSSSNFKSLLGQGYLAFTVDQGPDMKPYQGIVQLMGQSLSDCLLHYFDQSEQIPTAMQMHFSSENGKYFARALLLQSLPELKRNANSDDLWRDAMIMLASLKQDELLDETLSAEALLYRLFHEQGIRIHDPQNFQAKCRCSRDKMLRALLTLPPEDLGEDNIETVCEFCNQSYHFTLNEIKGDPS